MLRQACTTIVENQAAWIQVTDLYTAPGWVKTRPGALFSMQFQSSSNASRTRTRRGASAYHVREERAHSVGLSPSGIREVTDGVDAECERRKGSISSSNTPGHLLVPPGHSTTRKGRFCEILVVQVHPQ